MAIYGQIFKMICNWYNAGDYCDGQDYFDFGDLDDQGDDDDAQTQLRRSLVFEKT